ncbi:MAG: hypothetical protein ISS79_05045 [Phycisphaerae bacterium]|nr:hypothetical protein [Phycisphaerae bacterium]
MAEDVAFQEVLEFFEEQNYKLSYLWLPYRVFVNRDDPESLPWYVEVENRMVPEGIFEKIREFFS